MLRCNFSKRINDQQVKESPNVSADYKRTPEGTNMSLMLRKFCHHEPTLTSVVSTKCNFIPLTKWPSEVLLLADPAMLIFIIGLGHSFLVQEGDVNSVARLEAWMHADNSMRLSCSFTSCFNANNWSSNLLNVIRSLFIPILNRNPTNVSKCLSFLWEQQITCS